MASRQQAPPAHSDTRLDRLLDTAILAGLLVLILVGFATSYRTLRDLAATIGGYPDWLAPAVPLSFDLGIVVLSLKVARAAREGRTAPLLRALVSLLSAATVAANASTAATWPAAVLHAVPPAMFVICFESVIVSARQRSLATMGLMPAPLPRLRAARWFLAPRTTWECWRRQVLATEVQAPVQDRIRVPRSPGAEPLPRRRPPAKEEALPAVQPVADRIEVVRTLLHADPAISTARLTEELASHGYRLSTRSVQRLRAVAAGDERPPAEPAVLRSISH